MKNIFFLTVLLLTAAGALGAQVPSWGDGQTSGYRESWTTSPTHPARMAFDGQTSTSWSLTSGVTDGWVESYWAAPQTFGSVVVDADLPDSVTLQVQTLVNNHWVALPGAALTGPWSGSASFSVPGTWGSVSHTLVSLDGAQASAAVVREVHFSTAAPAPGFGKIVPASVSFNQAEYINLKASRLWDGIADNSWFEPLWSFPSEVFQTDAKNKPTKIFPPYFGNPPSAGQLIWELDGTYQVQTLKAYLILGHRNVQFEFWDGQKWTKPTAFGASGSDSGQGWQRIDLTAPVSTNRIRITFPGGWDKANSIGELEVWGTGSPAPAARSLVLPPAAQDGKRLFTVDDAAPLDSQMDVAVQGLTTAPLAGDWNGNAWQANPATWANGHTLYRVKLDPQWYRAGTQFLRVQNAQNLRGVTLSPAKDTGLVDLGWPYSDGFFDHTSAGPNQTIPVWKHKDWNLGAVYSLERLRIYSTALNPPALKTGSTNSQGVVTWTSTAWTSQGAGWWEAVLRGVTADKLALDSPADVTVDEAQLWGTRLKDTTVGMEIWWPGSQTVDSSDSDSNSVIGWLGDPQVKPTVGGVHARQSDRLFWLPLNQLDFAIDNDEDFTAEGSLGDLGYHGHLRVKWTKNPPATFDQGEDLLVTQGSTVTLSGSVKNSKYRVFVNDVEISALSTHFSVNEPLVDGYQAFVVAVWDKNKKQRLISWTKEVDKTQGLPLLRLDLPYGDVLNQTGIAALTGRVGNGVGLSLTVNGQNVPLQENQFTLTIPAVTASSQFNFVLKDSLGNQSAQTLTINRDAAPPSITLLTPTPHQVFTTHEVTISASSGADQGLWWKIGSEDWELEDSATHTKTYHLPDGNYHFDISAEDRAGNLSAVAGIDFVVDTTAPQPFALSANVSGWTTNRRPVVTFASADATSGVDHYEANVDGAAWARTVSPLTLPTLSDGAHMLFVRAVDAAGNTTLSTLEIDVDTVAPAAFSATVNSAGWSSDNTPVFSFATTDATSGVDHFEVNVDGGLWQSQTSPYLLPALADGTHTLIAQAIDQAGNTTTAPTLTVRIDATAPAAFTPSIDVTGWTTNPQPVITFATTDATSGLARYEVKIDAGNWTAQTSPYHVPALADGAHTIGVRALDQAGNVYVPAALSALVDTTAPLAVTEFRLIPGDNTLQALWTTVDNDIVRYQVKRIQDGVETDFDTTETSLTQTQLSPGTVLEYQVRAVDHAGLVGPWAIADGQIVGLAVKALPPPSSDEVTVVEYQSVKLAVPPASLPPEVKAVVINTVESPDLEAKSDNPLVGPIYEFSTLQDDGTGTGTVTQTSHTEFSKEVLVTLDYDPAQIPGGFPESNLGVYYYDTLWSKWFRVEKAAIDTTDHKIVFMTNHFTSFSVQPTMIEDLKPQELADAGHSPFKSESRTGEVSVSPQGGTMSTEVTEFVLHGKNGFVYPVKRIYDTQTARVDSPNVNLSETLGMNFTPTLPADIANQLKGSVTSLTDIASLVNKFINLYKKNGDYPLALGIGWRLNFPFVRASDTSVIVRVPDGGYYPVNQMTMKTSSSITLGALDREITFENHKGDDFTFKVLQIRSDFNVSNLFSAQNGSTSIEINKLQNSVMAALNKAEGATYDGGGITGVTSLVAGLIPGWITYGSELDMKDGTQYVFDATGRIQAISDPSGTNVITFTYNAFSGELEKLVDPMGNVTTFEYNDSFLSGVILRPSISAITTTGVDGNTRTSTYQYDYTDGQGLLALITLPPMTSAVDVGGRTTTYGFDTPFVFSGGGSAKVNFLAAATNVLDPSGLTNKLLGLNSLTLNAHITLEWLRLINSVEAPGRGKTTVSYHINDLNLFQANFSDFFLGISWLPTAGEVSYDYQNRITTQSVKFANGTLNRTTNYDYHFVQKESQFIVDRAVIDDGQTKITQDYTIYSQTFPRYVSFDDALLSALKQGIFTQQSNDETDYYPLATKTTTADKTSGNTYQTETTSWYTDASRPHIQTTTRGTLTKTVTHQYDDWGNETQTDTVSYSAQGPTSLHVVSWFKGTTSAAPGTLPAGTPDTPSQSRPETKGLLLGTKTTFGSTSQDVTYQTFAYDDQARPIWQGIWTGIDWAHSTTEYYPVTAEHDKLSGQVNKTTGPTGQVTQFDYDFNTLLSQHLWIQTQTAQKVTDPLNVKTDVVTQTAFDVGTSWPRLVKDPEGDITETKYDALGRATDIIKPGDEAHAISATDWPNTRTNAPWDRIVYDDTHQTSTLYKDKATGSNPPHTTSNASEYYEYDSRGNLFQITKYDNSTGALKKSITKASYDEYNRVLSMSDPLEQTTSYTYDFLGRPLTITYADDTRQTIVYDDTLLEKDTTDERGTITRERLNWAGQDERVTADLGGLALLTQTFYDGLGRPVRVIDPLNQTTKTSYTPLGKPFVVTHPDLTIAESPTAQPTSASTLTSTTVTPTETFTYDAAGRVLTKQTGYTGHIRTTTLTYDGLGRTIKQEQDGRITYTWYDGSGRPVRQTDPDQSEIIKAADPGTAPEATGAKFTLTTYTSRGQVQTLTDPSGAEVTYEYDRDDRKVTMRDPRAVGADKETFSIYYTYDDLGRLTKADQPPVPSQARASTAFEYDARGNATKQTDPDGKVTKWTYDSRNRKTSQTTGTGSISIIHAWGYDAVGNKIKDIAVSTLNVDHPEDSTGLTTSTQYDAVNRPVEVDAPDGQKTFTIYDELGRVKTTQDAQGNTTSYFYNSLNKVTEVDQSLSKTTKNTYNVWGDTTSTTLTDTDTGDQLWIRGYNNFSQVSYEINNAGQAWSYTYNQRGLVKTSTDPNGTTSTSEYRVTGQPTSRTLTSADGTTIQSESWDYDIAGALKTATDGDVVTTINQSTGAFAANPYDLVTSYSTNVLGKDLSVATTYDNGQRPATLTYPDNTGITNTYNDLGQLTGINGFARNGTYDFAGHLTELDATNGTGRTKTWNTATGNLDGYQWTGTTAAARTLSWDNLGNLTAQTKDGNTSTYSYDALNRLTYAQEGGAVEVNTKDSSGTQYMSKTRDVAGRLSMNYSTASVQLDAAATSVGIDLGSTQQINKVRLTAASNRVSPRTLEVYLSSLGTSKSWTKATDVTLVPDNTGTTLEFAQSHSARFVKLHMTWDERDAGNNSLSTGATISGTPAQLIQVWFTVNGQMTTWSYDSLGNRLSQTQIRGIANQTTTAYYPYTNLIKTNGDWEFNYDANGNMTQRGTNGTWNSGTSQYTWANNSGELWTYVYDLKNRLVEVKHSTTGNAGLASVAKYTYDSRNLRVASTKAGKTTYFQYDPSGDLIWSDDGTTQIKYVQALGKTWAEVRTVGGVDTKYWHSVDHEGSTELITDSNGAVVWSGAYEAYGSLVRSNGTLDFTPSYTGKQFDSDTGLYYYNARWYEPTLGRFLSEDPARDGADWSIYASDSPLINVDPSGLTDYYFTDSGDPNTSTFNGVAGLDHQDNNNGIIGDILDLLGLGGNNYYYTYKDGDSTRTVKIKNLDDVDAYRSTKQGLEAGTIVADPTKLGVIPPNMSANEWLLLKIANPNAYYSSTDGIQYGNIEDASLASTIAFARGAGLTKQIGKATGSIIAKMASMVSKGRKKTLFRGERSSMTPEIIFKNGFKSKGSGNDLLKHTTSNTTPGDFVSTSQSKEIATEFAGKNGYVYEIETTNYVNVNKTLGADSPFPEQIEFAMPGGISPSEIKGAWVMKNGVRTEEFIPNPNFSGKE